MESCNVCDSTVLPENASLVYKAFFEKYPGNTSPLPCRLHRIMKQVFTDARLLELPQPDDIFYNERNNTYDGYFEEKDTKEVSVTIEFDSFGWTIRSSYAVVNGWKFMFPEDTESLIEYLKVEMKNMQKELQR